MSLKEIAKLYVEVKSRIADLEEQLKQEKRELAAISKTLLPEALEGQTSAEFGDMKITCKEEVYARLPSLTDLSNSRGEEWEAKHARRQAGLQVLQEIAPHLLKHKLSVSLGTGQADLVQRLDQFCSNEGIPCSVDLNVHPSTLANYIKERGEDSFTEQQLSALGYVKVTEAKVKVKK